MTSFGIAEFGIVVMSRVCQFGKLENASEQAEEWVVA